MLYLSSAMSSKPPSNYREQELLDVINQLSQENLRLQGENMDLQIALSTITEHGDTIEAELGDLNARLRAEIKEREKAESALNTILNIVCRQKEDLEILIQILTDHGDAVDDQWSKKAYEARQMAIYDSLTGLPNRRNFDYYLQHQWEKMSQSRSTLTILLCDIDFFKQYNDTYGHLVGDRCLQQVAEILHHAFADLPEGMIARYGGEEFAGIIPNISLEEVKSIANQIQRQLHNAQIPHVQSLVSDHITLSMGIAQTIPHPHTNATYLLEKADQLLYLAKSQGRNRVISSYNRG